MKPIADSDAAISDEQLDALLAVAAKRGIEIPIELRARFAMREAARRGLVLDVAPDFKSYVTMMNPTLLHFEHVPKLVDVADRVVRGLLRNVLVMLPTRYFKTEVFGRLLPSFYLTKFPMRHVGLTSYAADLAWDTSEAAQNYFFKATRVGEVVTGAKRMWKTSQGGRMWAAGMGGSLLGRGYNLGVVDDPIKPEQARSLTFQNRFQRWWPDTWLGRRQPRAQNVFVMQRLGPEDPIDLLLRREVGEKTEKAPMHWHVVVLDEIHSEEPLGRWSGPKGLPPTCTLEPDDRRVGTILAPSLFNAVEVAEIQAQAGPLARSAQRQQRPMMASGDFWRYSWFMEFEDLPEKAYNGGWDWDTAQSKEEANSASAGILSYRGPAPLDRPDEFFVYIMDVIWEWCEFPRLVKMIKERNGPHYVEAKSSGKSAVQALAAYGIRAKEIGVLGDKMARSSAVQPAVANQRVYVHSSVIQKLLYGERQGLLRITAEGLQMGGEGLDVNDAFVQCLFRHLQIGSKKRRAIAR